MVLSSDPPGRARASNARRICLPGLAEAAVLSLAVGSLYLAIAFRAENTALARVALVTAVALVVGGGISVWRQGRRVAAALFALNAAAVSIWLSVRLPQTSLLGAPTSSAPMRPADLGVLLLGAAAAGTTLGACLIGPRDGRRSTPRWSGAALALLVAPTLWSTRTYVDVARTEPVSANEPVASAGTTTTAATTTAATTTVPTTGAPSPISVSGASLRQIDEQTAELYVTLDNDGGTADALTGVLTSVAFAEVVGSDVCDGSTTLPPADLRTADEIPLPPFSSSVLSAGGCLVRLHGLRQALVAGSEVDVSLFFQNSGPIDIFVPVS